MALPGPKSSPRCPPWAPARPIAVALTVALVVLGGCRDTRTVSVTAPPSDGTARLGAASAPQVELKDAEGRPLPAPPVPAGATAQVAPLGREMALAAWIADNRVLATRYAPGAGWEAPAPLEAIAGQPSDVQLAANANGVAMAVWYHRVGAIRSLRYSRYEAGRGWSVPDVVPGALPRALPAGASPAQPHPDLAPRLAVDAHGNARAEWPSGFGDGRVQSSRYVAGHGWSDSLQHDVAQAGAPAAPSSRPNP